MSSVEEDDRPTSVVFDHCNSVYAEMHQQARYEPVEGDTGNEQLIYEGHLTKLVTGDLGLATPRYTAVMNHLKAMGCVEQIRRGGGSSPSRWLLVKPPDESSFRSIESMNRPNSGKIAVVGQQVRDLNKRLQTAELNIRNLQTQFATVQQMAREHEQELHAMRADIDKGVLVYNHVMKEEVGI